MRTRWYLAFGSWAGWLSVLVAHASVGTANIGTVLAVVVPLLVTIAALVLPRGDAA